MRAARPVIACLGAGRMGRGMAHAFAYSGHEVRLVDAKQRPAGDYARLEAAALDEVRTTLATMARIGAFDAALVDRLMGRVSVHPVADAGEALGTADFVFEAVPETEAAKRGAFALIDAHAAAGSIVASTTSTFLSTLVATFTRFPARTLNAHWLNPAYLVPLVEVSPHPETAEVALARLETLLEAAGKVAVRCKAAPGYIVPRIQALAMNEAARLVADGVASADDVDKAVRFGFGFRFAVLGLVEFIDWGGGDILHYASDYLAKATGEQRFEAPQVIADNMAAGHIGMRTGRGFYDWNGRDVDAYRREKLAAFQALLHHLGCDRPPVVDG